jgi:ATP-dependent DNA helicase RecQ
METENTDPLTKAVKELFGLSYLFPYQRLVVSNILEAAEDRGIAVKWPGSEEQARLPENTGGLTETAGRQIVILPTGAGKSLCFQLPAMLLPGITLVIYPILSLMSDQERRLAEKGFNPVTLRGGQDEDTRREIWKKLRNGESRFIIANPEALLSPRVMDRLGGIGILHIVIDEAHCVSEWGESFRPGYLRIGEIISAAGECLVTAFTATAGAPVLEKIDRYIFGSRSAHRIMGNPDRSNISYAACGCILRDPAVRDLLMKSEFPAIVFCSSRSGTEQLARYLRNEFAEKGEKNGSVPEVRFYHAGLSREEKASVEKWFFSCSGGVLTATCAYGLGIDKPDIRTVIHRDCPPSVEAYLQESGRAGRDGKQSAAVLLWGPEDSIQTRRAGENRRRVEALLSYARDTSSCRRGALLKLLDYDGAVESPERCCDVCGGKSRPDLCEEEIITGFIGKNRRAYTLSQAARILAGPGFWSEEEAKYALRELKTAGKLRILKNPLWKNKLTTGRNKRG